MTTLAVGRCDWNEATATSVFLFSFDDDDGSATKIAEIPTNVNPSWITTDATNRVMHVTGENSPNGTLQCFLYPEDITSEWKCASAVDVGSAPCHIAVVNDKIVSANYMGGNVSVLLTNERGELTDLRSYETKGSLPTNDRFRKDRQESPHPHHVEIIEDNIIAVSDLGLDTITILDSETGEDKGMIHIGEGRGVRRALFRNNLLYTMNELDNTLSVISYPDGNFVQESVPLLDDQKLSNRNHHRGGSDIAFSPCGKYLIAATRSTNQFVVFRVVVDDERSSKGSLRFVNRFASVCTTPRHVTFVGKKWFVAACHVVSATLHPEDQRSDCLAVFRFEDGVLTFVRDVPCEFASCVAVL